MLVLIPSRYHGNAFYEKRVINFNVVHYPYSLRPQICRNWTQFFTPFIYLLTWVSLFCASRQTYAIQNNFVPNIHNVFILLIFVWCRSRRGPVQVMRSMQSCCCIVVTACFVFLAARFVNPQTSRLTQTLGESLLSPCWHFSRRPESTTGFADGFLRLHRKLNCYQVLW
jgi:hypothetical protein